MQFCSCLRDQAYLSIEMLCTIALAEIVFSSGSIFNGGPAMAENAYNNI